MNTTSQLVTAPDNVPGGAQCEQLAYLDAYDAVLNGDYAFVAYKETDSFGWRVRIKSLQTAGVVFEPDAMRSNARSTGAQGKPWFQWGHSIDPSDGDQRCVQFRVHVTEGQPSEIEIFVQLRKFDGSADAPKSVKRKLALRGRNQLRDNRIEGASRTLLVGLQDNGFLEAFFRSLVTAPVD